VPYRTDISDAELAELCESLASRRASKVVVSGIPRGEDLVNFIYERGRAPEICAEPKIGVDRSGTGDVFASVILGDAVNGVGFADSVRKASAFTAKAVRRSFEMGLPEKDGLAIEEVLGELAR
jgi:pyridoxine kinase